MAGEETPKYIILEEGKVRKIQEQHIFEVSRNLLISWGEACFLLIQENWSPTSAVQNWRSYPQLLELPQEMKKEKSCKICWRDVEELDRMMSVRCGHPFCSDCWKKFVSSSMEEVESCLSLHCPEEDCKAIALDMVESWCSDDEKETFRHFLFMSYVVSTPNRRKWCPGPGCGRAVEFPPGEHKSYEVKCDCSYRFCWNCKQECHRPVDCETALKWLEKMSSFDQRGKSLKVETKVCPMCKQAVEKEPEGCDRVICPWPCRFYFCWLCLEVPGPEHFLTCKGKQPKTEEKEMNPKESHRYGFFREVWDTNMTSRESAVEDMNKAESELIPMFIELTGGESLEFVKEAWEQILECRQVLKWTDVYGYYTGKWMKPDNIEEKQTEATQAEKNLREYVEEDLKNYGNSHLDTSGFKVIRGRVKNLTCIAQRCINDLVNAIDKGKRPVFQIN